MTSLQDPVWEANAKLVERLFEECGHPADLAAGPGIDAPGEDYLDDATIIVSHIEVNDKHGVGVLLRRLFRGGRNLLSVRSQDHYGGEHDFGAANVRIAHETTSRPAVFRRVVRALAGHTGTRILCVPYYPDDARNAIALREICGAPLATYLMDDQNITTPGIPDELMRELLGKSSLRLAISPEMVVCYGLKYGHEFGYLPPLAPSGYVLRDLNWGEGKLSSANRGVMVGNIWGQRWLDMLRETVRDSGMRLHWYSNSHFRFLSGDRESLARDSIVVPDGPPLADEDLVGVLRDCPFAVAPSGTLDHADDRRFIAQLSLPSRIPFIMATSHAPLIVLGDPQTGAARFVEELGIGLVCPYDTGAFRETVARVCDPQANLTMRRNALAAAPGYSDEGAAEWIWKSLERGAPIDDRYQKLLPARMPDLAHLVRHPPPEV